MHRIKAFRYSITSSEGSFIEVWRSQSLSMKLGASYPCCARIDADHGTDTNFRD